MTKTIWVSTSAATTYVPREKPIQETVAPFTGSTSGAAPATTIKSDNTGQRILSIDGTWIPQPSFTSGGADQIETLRPSVISTTILSGNPPTITNPSYAYDVDTNHAATFGEWNAASEIRTNNRVDAFTFITWAAKVQTTWTSATINISRAYSDLTDGESANTTGSSSKTSSVLFEYYNGSTWTTLGTDTQSSIPTAPQTLSASISTSPTMNSIIVRVTMTRGGGGTIYEDGISLPGLTGSIDLKLFDIWIDGVYAGGAGNVTCNNLTVTGDATLQNKLYDGSGSAGTAGYILSSTGTKTAWVPDSVGSGTVTSITTTGANGVTISGGSTQTITTSGIFALALGAITPTSIATGTGSFTGDVEFASSIKSPNASNSPIVIAPDGTGDVHLNADSVRIGDNNADATIATRGTGDLIITTHEGSANEGIVRLYDGANGNITLTPNGTGQVKVGTDQVVTLVASQTLTNKSISGSANTLSNIANASLTNSTISGVALGSNLNALTISSPLTGTSYNGSSAVSIGIPVATTSVNGYLSSADWTTFNNKGSGSVTSVAATVPSLLSISGSPITTSGTLAITYSGTALPVANGGTGLTTLTAGYIPYGAGTSAFGSSANLFWDSANSRLGIGTATPSEKLNIYSSAGTPTKLYVQSDLNFAGMYAGTANSNRGAAIELVGHTDSVNSDSFKIQHANDVAAQALVFYYASPTTAYGSLSYSEKMRLDSSGNVGIGTASPASRLHVYTAGTNKLTLDSPAANDNRLDFAKVGTVKWSMYSPASSNDLRMYDHQTVGDVVTFASGGNVGIGTASPSNKLDVVGVIRATNGSIIANTGATVNAQFILSDNGTNKWQTYYDASAGSYNIYSTTASSVRLSIDSSGNVGIGTASPSAKLESISTTSGVGGWYIAAQLSAANYPALRFAATSPNKYSSIGNNGDGSLYFMVNGSSSVIGTEAAVITSAGNVGIGTASPSANLSVSGSSNTGIRIKGGSSALSYIDFDEADSGTPNGSIAYVHSTNYMTFGTGGSNTERMRIDSSGNVGIGTTTMNGRLNVVGSAASSIPIVVDSNATYGSIQTYNSSPLHLNPLGNNVIMGLSGSNVGIGTTSPTNKLQVNGVMVGNNAAGSYTKGFGGILTTTSTSTPTGGSSGDFALIY